MLRRIYTAIK